MIPAGRIPEALKPVRAIWWVPSQSRLQSETLHTHLYTLYPPVTFNLLLSKKLDRSGWQRGLTKHHMLSSIFKLFIAILCPSTNLDSLGSKGCCEARLNGTSFWDKKDTWGKKFNMFPFYLDRKLFTHGIDLSTLWHSWRKLPETTPSSCKY